ncbi:CdaR family transcriptional regulator [Streptomyces sp. NBC_01363]|uniref:PucR family transcriptional regulator n=1 Tax=Streptomyces sp. NBC_01363 TaxID=2903840 RepID=UPI0022539727|nr:helix-turn-helix domain-containing protein [Streptomyces sp. NBC_01363]MCX4735217.1 helix-turn-helix domain-containing protein [Streptomyces sp. NBC_01363]
MTLSDRARVLALRCEPRVNELARHMARESFEQLPGYAGLPDDVKDLEIAATVRHGVRLFLRRVTEPHPGPGGLRLFRERAAQRAEEGMPLHLLLRSHALGVYVLWQLLRETADPGEEDALIELVDLLLRSHHSLVGAVAETYMDERSALEAEQRERRRSLVRGFLDGTLEPGRALLEQLGLDGPALVLAVALEPSADAGEAPGGEASDGAGPRGPEPGGPEPGNAVTVRRRMRRVQTVLDQAFGGEPLFLFDAGAGRAVVPRGGEPPGDLAERLTRACGAEVRIAAVAAAAPEAVPEASRTAVEILRVARTCGLPPGLHVLDDVLLEFHLSRPGPSSHRIAALLDPVAGRPELLRTLRTHLAQHQDRRLTAVLLGLHPNTVDNRLARLTELTGLDPSSPRGAALAIAALLLRDTAAGPDGASAAG